MKGVLLYVVNPTDAILIREDFRQAKQGTNVVVNTQPTYNPPIESRVITPRRSSPRRAVYLSDGGIPPTTTVSYTPSKSSHTSSRDERAARRRRSPRKNRTGRSPARPSSDDEHKLLRKNRSQSLDRPKNSDELENQQNILDQQQKQLPVFQANQQMPLIPMGVYNRFVFVSRSKRLKKNNKEKFDLNFILRLSVTFRKRFRCHRVKH